jgi:ubiquinone biosynthesis protein
MTPSRSPSLMSRARNFERIRQISEVAVRHGFGYFFERHNLWQILHLRRRKADALPAQRGRHIREMLEELGPTFVKFGQLLSTRPDIVPPDVIEELTKLQDQVPGFPSDIARAVIEEDLGLSVERLFVAFEQEPIGAASIGQVYRAVLPGGHRVIIKVQRPTARQQIDRDLDLLFQIAELLRDHMGDRLFVDPTKIVDEFAQSIRRELDYTLEGRNIERFGENFRDDPNVEIPRVVWRYSTRRVLTMGYFEGPTLNEVDLGGMSLTERRALAEVLAGAWFKQIFQHGFFHGDPHPANLLYLGSERVALLDFGIVGMLSREDIENGTRLFLAILERDLASVKRRLRRLGVQWDANREAQVDEAIEVTFNRYFGLSLDDLDPAAFLTDLLDLIYSLHLQLPTRFVLLFKALITLEGVVSTIHPQFNVFESARPHARSLYLERHLPQNVADRLSRSLAAYRDVFQDYPFQLHRLLEEAKDGELAIRFVHLGLEGFAHKLDLLTNRLVMALIAVSMGVSSAFIAVLVDTGPQVYGLSIWGVPGLVAAAFFGVWLMWAILRSGRL